MMRTIDAQGKACPIPLIMTRKALDEISDDETLVILIDNDLSVKNVTRFLDEHQMKVAIEKAGNTYRLTVNKTGVIPESVKEQEYCTIESSERYSYAIAFQSNAMGRGNDDLGQLLMKGFINTLPEIEHKPTSLLFLNAGIFLTLKDSPVIESLGRLESEGTRILVCGTCLDFYGKKTEIGVGIISNMYDILDTMSKSAKVLYP